MRLAAYVITFLTAMWSVTVIHPLWYLPVAAWVALWSAGLALKEVH